MEETHIIDQPANPPAGRILVADDDEPFRRVLGVCFLREGFECDFASSSDEVIERLRLKEYDVLLSDINMPGNAGLEMIEKIPAVSAGLPVILLTGEPSLVTAARSVGLRVTAYLTKPPDIEELCRLLRAAVVECRNLRLLKDSRQRIQDWDREIARLQMLLQQSSAADRQATMQSYMRLTLRNLVVGLIELEHMLIHDGDRLGTNDAVEKQTLFNAIRKTIGVLHKTKDNFKSKELGELRKELETLVG